MGAIALAVGAVSAVGGPASGWPGDPDGTWGTCGTRVVDVTPGSNSGGAAIVMQADGKMLVGGFSGDRGLVERFMPDATADSGFGMGGQARFGPAGKTSVAAIALQGDGKIVVAGSRTMGGVADSVVARITASGGLDTMFNGTGLLAENVGGGDYLSAIAVQGDGAIVVAGTAGNGGFVQRLMSAGAPDTTFNTTGRHSRLPLSVQALALQADGKIVVGGPSSAANPDFALLRLGTNGAIDSSFGGVNGVHTDLGGFDVLTALAIQSDGKILAAGTGHGAAGAGHSILRRYTAAGAVDPTFHAVDRTFGLDDQPVAIAIRADGRILLAGNSRVGTDNDIVLARFTGDGTADAAFGIGGVSVEDDGANPSARGVALSADGRPLVVGRVRVGARTRLAVLGYQADGATAPHPTRGFVLDGYGGLRGFSAGCTGSPGGVRGAPHWPGWDIARGVAVTPGARGLVLDGWGGLHPFAFADGTTSGLTVHGAPYWRGWDIARGVAVVPEGTGGYEVDGWGGLHPFALGRGAMPAAASGAPYWRGWDIVRGVALLPDGRGGYVLDGWGGLHPFGGAPAVTPGAAYWSGQDIARGVTIAPDGSGGWVADAYGGLHPFGIGGNAPAPLTTGGPFWVGWKIVRGVAALP